MRRKIFLKIIIGITAIIVIASLLTKMFVEPWIAKKIISSLSNNTGGYKLEIEKVHVSVFQSGIELDNITLLSEPTHEGQTDLTGEIESIKFKNISLLKALFKKDVDIREVDIINSRLKGKIAFQKGPNPVKVSPINIRIGNLFFDKMVIDIKSTSTSQAFSIKDGIIKCFDINVKKNDTILLAIFGQLDFDALEIKVVPPDSLHTFSVDGISYSSSSNILSANRFLLQPNYSEYGFTSLSQFQTNHIVVDLGGISFHDFFISDYIKSGDIISSYIEIEEMAVNVFRDKRKEFKHVNKPIFQELMYNYPGTLNVDSIGILSGNVVYTEYAEKANEKGSLNFDDINATIYNVTNDTIYRTKKEYLRLKANALLMGKSKINVSLEAKIFDSENTFSASGTLSEMELSDLNPFLEKSAFVYISSGKINSLDFSFSANNTKATGSLKLLYEELNLTLINKESGSTTAIKERLKSSVVNMLLINSNPKPGKEVRPGIIDFERDPEKFLFSYYFKSIMSGIKPTLGINPNSKRKL